MLRKTLVSLSFSLSWHCSPPSLWFPATNIAEFTFKPDGGETEVTWSMRGEKNFIAKAIHLFLSMDKMIGGQFEKGLASMKAAAEKFFSQNGGER